MPGKSNPDYNELTDEQLIFKFQNEDLDAFNEIVYRFKDRLFNFLFRYTGNKEDAEDLAQESFIKLYMSKHLYTEIAKFSTWFYTMALNLARTQRRAKFSKSRGSGNQTLSLNEVIYNPQKNDNLTSSVLSTDSEANSSTESYHIQKAINSLDDKHKEVIILRDIQDFDYEEISKILEVPLGTVRSRINRAREQLKEMLEKIYRLN